MISHPRGKSSDSGDRFFYQESGVGCFFYFFREWESGSRFKKNQESGFDRAILKCRNV